MGQRFEAANRFRTLSQLVVARTKQPHVGGERGLLVAQALIGRDERVEHRLGGPIKTRSQAVPTPSRARCRRCGPVRNQAGQPGTPDNAGVAEVVGRPNQLPPRPAVNN
jgi:hypothetical protein